MPYIGRMQYEEPTTGLLNYEAPFEHVPLQQFYHQQGERNGQIFMVAFVLLKGDPIPITCYPCSHASVHIFARLHRDD